jgi:hypothetical protein
VRLPAVPSKLPWHRFKKAVAEIDDPQGFRQVAEAAGGFDNLGTVVDLARKPGPDKKVFPSVAAVPEADLSKLDRYAHGGSAYKMMPPVFRDTPLAPLAVGGIGAVYEASKALPTYFGSAVAAATDPSYSHDASTSKPSAGNVMSLMRGYADAQAQANAKRLRKLKDVLGF